MNRTDLQKMLLADFGHLGDKQLMALIIYGEARGESREGQIAVGSVILERVDHRSWDGDTIQTVCLMPYQFSCILPSDSNYTDLKITARNFDARCEKSSALQRCYAVASGLIDGTIARTPEIAAHHVCQYLTAGLRQQMDKTAETLMGSARAELDKKRWWTRMALAATVGHHEFYA